MTNSPLGVLARGWRSLLGKPVDLNIISGAIHHGCMGLPQELIDRIMDMLHDLEALKACALTCKAMFASTRHLIHQQVHLDLPRKQRQERPHQKQGQRSIGNPETALRFMAYMGDYDGLLRYARQVRIRTSDLTFTPESLLPYLQKFQSLDRVHTLTILDYAAITWTTHFETCFHHFYPTLTTLTLQNAFGPYELLLQFALQFPNLENLSLEWLSTSNPPVPVVINHSPPLRGHLRLAGNCAAIHWPVELTRGLSGGPNFRSIELDTFFGIPSPDIFNMCAYTLEHLIIRPQDLYEDSKLRNLNFTSLEVLRRFTFRRPLPRPSGSSPQPLLEALSTIRSPTFRELEFEWDQAAFNPTSYWRGSPYYGEIDAFLEERFAKWGNFRLVIRLSGFPDRETIQKRIEEAFPLLARRGCIHSEVSYSSR